MPVRELISKTRITNNKRRLAKLHKYEKLESSGRLLILPCKLNDEVYCVEKTYIYGSKQTKPKVEYKVNKRNFTLDMLKDFGDTVFLEEDIANKKMKELKSSKKKE